MSKRLSAFPHSYVYLMLPFAGLTGQTAQPMHIPLHVLSFDLLGFGRDQGNRHITLGYN